MVLYGTLLNQEVLVWYLITTHSEDEESSFVYLFVRLSRSSKRLL